MNLHISELWKVNQMLKRFATNHYLALDNLDWIFTFVTLQYFAFHGSDVSSNFQESEQLDKLSKIVSE